MKKISITIKKLAIIPIETGESNNDNQPAITKIIPYEEPRRSGRFARLIEDEEFGNSVLSRAEIEYYLAMTEIGLIAKETGYVGAASTTGFGNTSELRPITYEEAMSGPEKEQWKKANKWYLCGTVPLSHIHIIFTVYIVYKPPREWVQWL